MQPTIKGELKTKIKTSYQSSVYFLKKNVLYTYIGDEHFPSFIIILEGRFVEKYNTDGNFGFKITSYHQPPITLFAEDMKSAE